MTTSLQVPTPDLAAATASTDRRAAGLPTGSLGELAVVVDALAALRGAPADTAPTAHLSVFAGDHGIAANRISTLAPGQTPRLAADLAAGRGPVATLARHCGVPITVLDLAIDDADQPAADPETDPDPDPDPDPIERVRVRVSSGAIDTVDALTLSEVANAIQAGRDEADRRIDAGADLLIGALCGVAADVPALAIATVLTGVEPVEAAGRDDGIDDDAWGRRVAAIRDARFRLTIGRGDAATLLQVAGGADLAALTGFVLQAALRGIPVLLDDVPGAVAAVLAHRFAPGAEHFVLPPVAQPGEVHQRLLDLIARPPLFDWSPGTGGGAASLLTVQLLRAAVALDVTAPGDHPDRAPWAVRDWATDLL